MLVRICRLLMCQMVACPHVPLLGKKSHQKKWCLLNLNKKKSEKKVVSRTAKKSVNSGTSFAAADVLKPRQPSSDLWAQNEPSLRMPRMDEINVVRYDALLPEESLDSKPLSFAKNNTESDDLMAEIDVLRAEVNRLSQIQQAAEAKFANVRPVSVRTPIAGESNVRSVNGVNVRREVVPMETQKDIAVRSGVLNTAEPKMVSVNDMTKMSPNELKKAFKKTYLSENKHLSTYQIDDKYDVVSDMASNIEGFSAQRDLSEISDGVRPLEIKISFLNNDASLSRENYNLLSETASIVVNNPKRAIQIAIPESVVNDKDSKKLAARRLAIVEQVLRDTGVAEQRIVPVLSQRSDDAYVLRIISGDLFETLTQQKKNMFGDDVSSKKTYKSMSW